MTMLAEATAACRECGTLSLDGMPVGERCDKCGASPGVQLVQRREDFLIPRRWIRPLTFPDGRRVNQRTHFDPAAMAELAESLRLNGMLQSLVVRMPADAGEPEEWTDENHPQLELVAGERRWRAADDAELEFVPCVLRVMSFEEAARICAVENAQRQDLSPVEEARTYEVLLALANADGSRRTQTQVAQEVGKTQEVISRRVRLLALPAPVLDLVDAGVLGPSQAYNYLVPFAGIPDEYAAAFWASASEALAAAEGGRWSDRDLEAAIGRVATKHSRPVEGRQPYEGHAKPILFDPALHKSCPCKAPAFRYDPYGTVGEAGRGTRCFNAAWYDEQQANAAARAEAERTAAVAALAAAAGPAGEVAVVPAGQFDKAVGYQERVEVIGWSGKLSEHSLIDPRLLPPESLVWVAEKGGTTPYLYCTDLKAAKRAQMAASRELGARVKARAEDEVRELVDRATSSGQVEGWMLGELLQLTGGYGGTDVLTAAEALGVKPAAGAGWEVRWAGLPPDQAVKVARLAAITARHRREHGTIESRLRKELRAELEAFLPHPPTPASSEMGNLHGWTPYEVHRGDVGCDGCEDGTLYSSVCTRCRGELGVECECEDDGMRFLCTTCDADRCAELGLSNVVPTEGAANRAPPPPAAPGSAATLVRTGRAGLPTKRPAAELTTTQALLDLRVLHIQEGLAAFEAADASWEIRRATATVERRYRSLARWMAQNDVPLPPSGERSDFNAAAVEVSALLDLPSIDNLVEQEIGRGPDAYANATCRFCGCTDSRACPDGCAWVVVDRHARTGVCSSASCAAKYREEQVAAVAAASDAVAGQAAAPGASSAPLNEWRCRFCETTEDRMTQLRENHASEPFWSGFGAAWFVPPGDGGEGVCDSRECVARLRAEGEAARVSDPVLADGTLVDGEGHGPGYVFGHFDAADGFRYAHVHSEPGCSWGVRPAAARVLAPPPPPLTSAVSQRDVDGAFAEWWKGFNQDRASGSKADYRHYWRDAVRWAELGLPRPETDSTGRQAAYDWRVAYETAAGQAATSRPEPHHEVAGFAPEDRERSDRVSEWFDEPVNGFAKCLYPGCGASINQRPAARAAHRKWHERRGESLAAQHGRIADTAERAVDLPAAPEPHAAREHLTRALEVVAVFLHDRSPADDAGLLARLKKFLTEHEARVQWEPSRFGSTNPNPGWLLSLDPPAFWWGSWALSAKPREPMLQGADLVAAIRDELGVPVADEPNLFTAPASAQPRGLALGDTELAELVKRGKEEYRTARGYGIFHPSLSAFRDAVHAFMEGKHVESLSRIYDTPQDLDARAAGWAFAERELGAVAAAAEAA